MSSSRKVMTWAIVIPMLVVVCSSGTGSQHDRLGEDASRAIGQWPAAQQAEESWEWVRVLVYLVQVALGAQGLDPGKPDGLMGPNTMMALLEWRRVRVERSDEAWGSLAGSVAHVLHATLRKMRLSPGPRDQILGRQSVAALERWNDSFLFAGYFMGKGLADAEAARMILLEDFRHTPAPVVREAKRDRSPGIDEGQDRATGGTGKNANHCIKFAWEERFDWLDNVYQTEAQDFRMINTCDYPIWFAWKDNGLAFGPDSDEGMSIYIRPPVNSCDLADDQQRSPRAGILDRHIADEDESDPKFRYFRWHENGRVFLLGGAIARVNYCARKYEGEFKGQSFHNQFDGRPPDCVYRMPRPCGRGTD